VPTKKTTNTNGTTTPPWTTKTGKAFPKKEVIAWLWVVLALLFGIGILVSWSIVVFVRRRCVWGGWLGGSGRGGGGEKWGRWGITVWRSI